jgi:predicted dehydrogenase
MSILRFGVIGIGYGQAVLVPAIRRDPRAVVVALAASTLSKAQKVAAELKVPHAYGNWRDMLEVGGLDVVAVAVPPHLQAEILIEALERGLAVFAEKPLAMNMREADRITVAQKMFAAKSAVDFNFTGVKAFAIAREKLRLGVIGPLRHVVVNWQVESYANRNRLTNWKTDSSTGGGTLFNFVSHPLHYLEWMSGDRIDSLSARLWGIPGDTRSGDASVALHLEFASGAAGMVAVSAAANHGNGHEVAFYGENGAIMLRNSTSDYMRGFELLIANRDQSEPKLVSIEFNDALDEHDGRILPTASLISQLIDSINIGEKVECDLYAGRRVQALIEAALTSDRRRCWVSVESKDKVIEAV